MQIGFIGLGKMGLEMVTRARNDGHDVICFDNGEKAKIEAEKRQICIESSLELFLNKLNSPKVVWLQTPPGKITNDLIQSLKEKLGAKDLLIDGGNSDFRESVQNGKNLQDKNIDFMDIGVSGGVQGARDGCGLLVGGSKENYERLIPFFQSLAAPDAYAHCGDIGAGHYAKAIHNGVQYAVMQAYAEGYAMLRGAGMNVNVLNTLNAYQGGCTIRSHILQMMIDTLEPNVNLDGIKDVASDSGMGRWTVEESIRLKIPTPTITAALQARFVSQQEVSPAIQCIAAMRNTIGGHTVQSNKKEN